MSDISEALKIPEDREELRERVIGANCPRCGAHDVDYGSVEVDTGLAYQRGDCVKCDFEWHEHYEITEITYPDPADDKRETWRSIRDEGATELAREVLKWAKTPGEHGGNPYFFRMVKMARMKLKDAGIDEDSIAAGDDQKALKA